MAYGWQHTGRVNDIYQKLYGPKCMSDYIKTKTDFEQKIDAIPYNTSIFFCKKCIALKSDIIEKTKGLQQCYNSSQLHPIESIVNIKEFIDKCPDLPNCSYPPNNPVRKPVASKVQKTYSCPGSRNCEGKTVIPDEQKSKAPPGISARNPQAGRSEEKSSLKEDRGHSDGNELRDGKVILQTKPEANPPSDSVRIQDKGSEPTVNQPSVSTDKAVTPTPHVSTPPTFTSTEFGTAPSAHSSQSSVPRDSHSTGSTQEDLNIGGPTTNLAGVQIEGLNQLRNIDVGGPTNLAGVQIEGANQLQNIDVAAQNSQGLAHDNTHAIETSVATTTDIGSTGAVDSDPENTGTEEDSSASLASSPSGDEGNSGITEVDISNDVKAPDGESHNVIISHDHRHDSRTICNESTCRETRNNELTDDGGDKSHIFNQIFSTIQANKGNVIKTSIPMGIVLLLSLLFKYTPLWRLLTKRKRNKRSHMNEKLQRVLQQPSIASEERSIPFSYSTFEYSS
ncbi:PIR protein [Plasmodium vivax]|uniref:VIR protein n=1 Tax=Plasmodium vivax TaxID=5855 RepID=A0A564ZPT9_PLAVI|nr:PIR protein [Plasmodium vivax]